jgi:hypothetical protein
MGSDDALILSQVLEEETRTTKEPVAAAPPPRRLIVRFVKAGFARASALPRLALLLLAINIIFALVLTLPMYGLLDHSLGPSLMGDRSLRVPEVNWLIEFLQSNQPFIDSLSTTILWVGLSYMAFNTLLTAGLLEVIYSDHRFSLRRFYGGVVMHGAKFLRLLALSLVIYFLIFLVFNQLLGRGLERWTRDWASDAAVFTLFLVKNILLGVVLLLAVMVFDYAKIRLVMERSRSVLAECLWTLRFVSDHRWLTLGVFYAVGLVGVALMVLYLSVDALLTPKSLWVLVAAFVLQQAFMFSRMWLRVAFYSAEMELYKQPAR